MGGIWVFVPFSLKAIQFFVEIRVVDVDFMRINANDGT